MLKICVSCGTGSNQVSGVGTVTTFSTLIALVKSADGWITTLPTSRERSIVTPALINGAVFFPAFIPNSDLSVAAGTSNFYALFYLTGSADSEPIFGLDGSGQSKRSVSLGEGLVSHMAIQLRTSPTGMSGFYQSTNALTGKLTPKAPLSPWSQYVSWISQRE